MGASDEDLVAASLRGDREAFARIVERHQALVCAVTYSTLGDLTASEDAAQEAFIAAWRSLPSLREPARLRPWLAGIARNVARAAARRRGGDVVAGAASLGPSCPVPEAQPGPEEVASRSEEGALLWGALARVPDRYRHVLVLYYREHQSVREVAAALGLNEAAVKQRLTRGRRALKAEVEGQLMASIRRPVSTAAFTASVLAALDVSAGKAAAAGTAVLTSAVGGTVTGATVGVLGGILGSLIGIAGAAFGVACSLRAARSRGDRAFLVKLSWAMCLAITVVVALYLLIAFRQSWLFVSPWFQAPFWGLYSVTLTASIWLSNRHLARIQREDATSGRAS